MDADLRVVPTGDWNPDDPDSFGRVYDEHFGRIYNYIRYRVRDAAVADDLASLTFHKALDRRFTFDPTRAGQAPNCVRWCSRCLPSRLFHSRAVSGPKLSET